MHILKSKFILINCYKNTFKTKKKLYIISKAMSNFYIPVKSALINFGTLKSKKHIYDREKSDKIHFILNPINCKRHYNNISNTKFFNKPNTGFKMNSFSSSIDQTSTKKNRNKNSINSQNINNQTHSQSLCNFRSTYRHNNLFNKSDKINILKMSGNSFKPKKALILTKFSRLEYERTRLNCLTEEEIKENLIRRGSDYEDLLNHHNIHTKSREHIIQTLREFGIECKVVDRHEYTKEKIDWADFVITTGGDGTFLMGASKIFCRNKLIIGINSDPSRSMGHLCLEQNYSLNFKPALDKLFSGDFQWIYRQRIRISIKGENANDPPAELYQQKLLHPEFRYFDLETHPLNRRSNSPFQSDTLNYEYNVLPSRALNDVFVGECLSSRVSYFELSVENKPYIKVKSSGVTICTGTGSTSWSFSINKISPQSIQKLFNIINDEVGSKLETCNQELTQKIAKKFNDSLIFDVCKKSMAYVVRDPIYMGNNFEISNRSFAKNLKIKSRMFDACVVIDGGLTYKFNDGAYAKFELLDEDQLKTVYFKS